MSKERSLSEASGVSIKNGVLSVKSDIQIDERAGGSWVASQGSKDFVLTAPQVDALSSIQIAKNATLDLNAAALAGETLTVGGAGTLNISDISFVEADAAANNKFEPTANLDSFLGLLIGPAGANMDQALNLLTVNGGEADAFKLVWDYLDDIYNAVGYYNDQTNEAFVRLGVEYAQYLKDGGVPLTDIVVKFTPDDADSNITPERMQSLHDNLLGNFDAVSLLDRFGGASAPLYQQVVGYVNSQGLGELLTRPIYSGSDAVAGDALDTIAWDVEHGYLGGYDAGGEHGGKGRGHDGHDDDGDGDDDHEKGNGHDKDHGGHGGRSLNAKGDDTDFGNLDPSSTRDGAGPSNDINVGAGNTAANYNISVNHEADIELGLKLHYRNGPDILPTHIGGDGTAYYDAPDGIQTSPVVAPNRAAWNFDFSVNTGIEGSSNTLDDYDFRIVIRSGDGEVGVFDLQHLGPGLTPWTNAAGAGFLDEDGLNPQISQNSVNLGFGFMQAIFGTDYNDAGEHYDIWLLAYDGNKLLASVHDSIDIV